MGFEKYRSRQATVKTEYDVIVVGAGGSGLATAVSAASVGRKVLVLEKEANIGGTTGIAVGSFTGNRTSQQGENNINDSWENHATDVAQFAPPEIEALNNTRLRDYFLQETAATMDWLTEMGLRFSGPHPEPPNRIARMHNIIPGAQAYIKALRKQLHTLGGDLLTSAKVNRLDQTGNLVCGVEYEHAGETVKARARHGVVLAAGDYANGHSLISKHKGNEFGLIDGINLKATGDGHKLASAAGAHLLNMDVTYGPEIRFIGPSQGLGILQWAMSLHLPTQIAQGIARLTPPWIYRLVAKELLVTWQHPEDSLFRDGAILLNQTGKRFCNELDSPQRELEISRQAEKQAFILMDQQLVERYSKWPHYISTAPKIAYAYTSDYLKRRPDIACKETSLQALCAARSPLMKALPETIERYNQSIQSDTVDQFARKKHRRALTGNQWLILGPAKAYFTTTEGGAAINTQFNVLRENGSIIKGLYAVGQNGLGGQILWGHGLHIAWAMTSGRLCGQQFRDPKPN